MTPARRRTLGMRLLALAIGLFCSISAAVADDIDIYTNPATTSLKPPYTVLVLDLNLLGLCPAGQTASDGSQLCLSLTTDMLLGDLLTSLGADSSDLVRGLLTSTYQCTTDTDSSTCTLNATILCDLYDALGLTSLELPIPGLNALLQALLGTITTLSCRTVTTLLNLVNSIPVLGPLLGGLLNTIMGSFVGSLIDGLVDPLLSTVVAQLSPTIENLLQTTLSGLIFTFLANVGVPSLISLLESILNTLINTNVAIMVSHADRSSLAGIPLGNRSSLPAANCAFADAASIPGPRRTTVPSPGCSNGAYVLIGFTTLVDQGSVRSLLTTVANLLLGLLKPTDLLNNLSAILATTVTTPTQLLPPFQAKEVYAELSHYLAGDEVYNAPLRTYDGIIGLLSPAANQMDASGRTVPMQDASGNYIAPRLECDTANVINVMLTHNTRDRESNTTLNQYFPALPIDSDPFSKIKGSVDPFTLADVVRQAKNPGFDSKVKPGHKITLNSYFLLQSLLGSTSALANAGATVLTYLDALGLLGLGQTIGDLVKPTLSVNASLLTPSFTLDLAKPSVLREEAFFAGFKPTADKTPRWPGNVKRLKRLADGGYVDKNGVAAIADDGRIETTATTFWSNTPDGREVTAGGAGAHIVGSGGGNPGMANAGGARKLYYDTDSAGLSALNVAASGSVDATLKSALGAASDDEARALLRYVRGYNVGTTAAPVTSGWVGRDWLHGAVLHSRPVAINYGGSTPDIRVVYGAADGFLRMVSSSDGSESWGFMPQAVMGQQKVLRDNMATPNFPYGVDGAPAVLLQDRNTSGGPGDGRIESGNAHDKAYVYFGLRRSGRHYYALNVTNPDSPSLLWRIGPDGLYRASGKVAGTDGHYAELALSFSAPQVGRLRINTGGSNAETRSVVIFAGGYNGSMGGTKAGKDLHNSRNPTTAPIDLRVGQDDALGNAIYIVDATTGELLWKAVKGVYSASSPYDATARSFKHPQLTDSIASDVTAVDTDGDGFTDRLYVADTGGRLWRADLPGSDRSAWTLTPLASVGRHDRNDLADDRRFFHAPDYVPFREGDTIYDAIVFASGDREDPYNEFTENYLYVLRDFDTVTGKTAAQVLGTAQSGQAQVKRHRDFADVKDACSYAMSGSCVKDGDESELAATGWKLKLGAAGEKALSQPLTTAGMSFLTTYIPEDADCEPNEGSSRLYGLMIRDSRPVDRNLVAGFTADTRSIEGDAPGLPGEFTPLSGNALGVNAQTLAPQTVNRYDVFWREWRNDEELPP